MSYTITVAGHKATDTLEETMAHEEAVRAKAQAFVAGLEGVNAAYMDGAATGHTDLMPAAAAPAQAEGEATSGV